LILNRKQRRTDWPWFPDIHQRPQQAPFFIIIGRYGQFFIGLLFATQFGD